MQEKLIYIWCVVFKNPCTFTSPKKKSDNDLNCKELYWLEKLIEVLEKIPNS